MASYKKILVPVDVSNKSDKSFKEALSIAKQYGASVIAFYVLPFSPVSYRDNMIAQETMFKEAKSRLEKLKDVAQKENISIQTKMCQGHPGQHIANFANDKKNKIDLVVIGSRDLGGLKEIFLGSVSNFVIHKSKVTTVVIKC